MGLPVFATDPYGEFCCIPGSLVEKRYIERSFVGHGNAVVEVTYPGFASVEL